MGLQQKLSFEYQSKALENLLTDIGYSKSASRYLKKSDTLEIEIFIEDFGLVVHRSGEYFEELGILIERLGEITNRITVEDY